MIIKSSFRKELKLNEEMGAMGRIWVADVEGTDVGIDAFSCDNNISILVSIMREVLRWRIDLTRRIMNMLTRHGDFH